MAENSNKPDDIAAEYVLGTLQGIPRLQFERMMRDDRDMRLRVREWEDRLFCLTEGITPVPPPKQVWEKIQVRIHGKAESKPVTKEKGWWKLWGIAASFMLLIMSVAIVIQQPSDDVLPPTLAVLSDKSSQAAWVVRADYQASTVTAQALKVPEPGTNKAYELWMLPKGEAPKSLGLLPLTGKRSVSLGEEKLAVLKRSGALAVSLEPAGGSPTGLPTGPVLYQGKVLNI